MILPSKFVVTMLSSALILSVAVTSASAQHVDSWVKRQVKGGARHAALRHHKPNEPVYTEHTTRTVTHHTVKHKKKRHHIVHKHITKHHG